MNFIKYLILREEDKRLGFNILHGGHNLVKPYETYPIADHPDKYKFLWKNGRRFDEFQVLYIINGRGVFESHSAGSKKIVPGSIVLLFPNEWHRYKPSMVTGWDEYWFGFSGFFAENLMNHEFFRKENPVLPIGLNEKIFNAYTELIELIKNEPPGSQMMAAGIALQIIGQANNLLKKQQFEGKEIEQLIKKSRLLLIENLAEPVSPREIARQLNLGYSWFRKMFKEYTGLAPGQFQMQHRIIKAKEFLVNQTFSVKEISALLGFESTFHFSKTFKAKTGYTPGQFRKLL